MKVSNYRKMPSITTIVLTIGVLSGIGLALVGLAVFILT